MYITSPLDSITQLEKTLLTENPTFWRTLVRMHALFSQILHPHNFRKKNFPREKTASKRATASYQENEKKTGMKRVNRNESCSLAFCHATRKNLQALTAGPDHSTPLSIGHPFGMGDVTW